MGCVVALIFSLASVVIVGLMVADWRRSKSYREYLAKKEETPWSYRDYLAKKGEKQKQSLTHRYTAVPITPREYEEAVVKAWATTGCTRRVRALLEISDLLLLHGYPRLTDMEVIRRVDEVSFLIDLARARG